MEHLSIPVNLGLKRVLSRYVLQIYSNNQLGFMFSLRAEVRLKGSVKTL
jgi:hypothetical protein